MKARVRELEIAAAEKGAFALVAAFTGAGSLASGVEDWVGADDGRAHPGGMIFGLIILLVCAALLRERRRILRQAEYERFGL